MNSRLLQLSDGRELAWAEMGDPTGYPVFAFHGTPGSRHQVLVEPASALAAGARVIAPDRPGYGASTRQRRRTFEGWANDVAELADHLGIERFAVFGLFTRPRGFELGDITVPVQVWQGDVDVNVPAAHGERQAAAIPGAVLHIVPGEGHLMFVDRLEEILRELLASRMLSQAN